MHSPTSSLSKRSQSWIFLFVVIALSYTTYFHRYWNPPYVFWDENYHIASAQKYLHGVFFMEQHPPLGKLLVALGEKMIHPNEQTDQFLGTDYGTDFSDGFSFAGYRFFSAFLAWMTAPLLFAIFLLLLRNPLHATLLSFLYIFDNAMIVHLRGAMLEGPLMFFSVAIILSFLLVLRDHEKSNKLLLWSALFGLCLGLAMTTKVLSLIFVLLFVPIAWTFGWKAMHWLILWVLAVIALTTVITHPLLQLLLILSCAAPAIWMVYKTLAPSNGVKVLKKTLIFAGGMLVPFLIVYISVWSVHFRLGQTVNSNLPDNGYYQASPEFKAAVDNGQTSSWMMFPVMLRDSLAFVGHYNSGAPRLDLCKADENGSPPMFWPLGARTINYRWQTPEGTNYSYLYLVPNPVVWWSALAGLLLAIALLITPLLVPIQKPLKNRFLMLTFVVMYFAYMATVSTIDRVLYLYHYFIPLFFTIILTGLVFDELQSFGKKMLQEYGKTAGLLAYAALIFLGFQWYRPFTYYEPINDAAFNRRDIMPLWDMHCVNCQNESVLVIPSK